jgi:hypothetical protein
MSVFFSVNSIRRLIAVFMLVASSATANASTSLIQILTPAASATVSGSLTIRCSTATKVEWVNFYVDKMKLASSPPYSITWNSTGVANGTHTIKITGSSSNDVQIASVSEKIVVANPSASPSATPTPTSTATPVVSIISPVENATVSGSTTVVAAVNSSVWWAEFYVDGTSVAVSPPYQFVWDTSAAPNGTHNLFVSAFGENGVTPIGSASIDVIVSNGVVTSSHFDTLPPGSALPTDAECASLIAITPETVSENATANSIVPTSADLGTFYADPFWFTYGPLSTYTPYTNVVDGNYVGSTDMILRWAACKWGIDEDVVRAEAWVESGWIEGTSTYNSLNPPEWGDFQSEQSECTTPAWNGWSTTINGCYQSCGIVQNKVFDFNVWPAACESTAFNADFRFAMARACIDGNGESWYSSDVPSAGYSSYPDDSTDQMLWGCIGAWYSGSWYDSGALSYINATQSALATQPWP